MPDRASVPLFDKCTSCALSSESGAAQGALPKSHTEVCCLYKFDRHGQPPTCLKEVSAKGPGRCDGLCKDCPSRLMLQQQLHVGPGAQPPRGNNDAPQEAGAVAKPTVDHPGTRKCSKIVARQRKGFKKLTIEIRPPRFKKKLWFGTYEPEEVDRAKDAINFYMGNDEPFILPDSPLIFAEKPLEMKYAELDPSCEEFVRVGQKQVRKSVAFAKLVKNMIVSVTRKQKAKTSQKCKASIQKMDVCEPAFMPSASGSTSSSIMPSASGSTSGLTFTSADETLWDISNPYDVACGPPPEANSYLVPLGYSFPSPAEMHTSEGEFANSENLMSQFEWVKEFFALDEPSLPNCPPVVAPLGGGESCIMEDNGFSPGLWYPFSM